MKKKNPLILSIHNPCHENWAEMTVVDKGRFCSHCQKTVTDITGMSDAAIVQLFQEQTNTHCIRAFSSQLNRPVTLPAQAPSRFYRIAVAFGLTIMMAGATDAYARPKAPLTEQNYLLDTGDSTKEEKGGGDSIIISGVVVDEEGAPFGGVILKVMQGGLLKSGTITEDDGTFSLVIPKGDYEMEFSSASYTTHKLSVEGANFDFSKKIKVSLQPSKNMEYNIIVGMLVSPHKPFYDKGKSTLDAEDLKKLGY